MWLALALEHHDDHHAARDWLDSVVDAGSVRFCRATQLSLLRLLTTAAVYARVERTPLTNSEAWDAYDAFVADDRVAMQADEPAGLATHWRRYSSRGTASPKLWMDAYLAAFAAGFGWTMVTTDGAFRQFADLDVLILN